MSSRTTRAIHGLLTDTGGWVILSIVQLLVVPLYLDLISSELYGAWLTLLSIIGWVALTDMGVGTSLERLISSNSGTLRYGELVSTTLLLFICIAALFFIVGYVTVLFLFDFVHIVEQDSASVKNAFIILLASSLISLPLSIFGSTLNGLQKLHIVNICRVFSILLGIVVTFILLIYFQVGIESLAIGRLFTILLEGIINAIYLYRFLPNIKIRYRFFNKNDAVSLMSFGGFFQLAKLANTISINTDNIVISIYLGAGYVTPYFITSKLATLISQSLASKLPSSLFPGLSELFSNSDSENIVNIFTKLSIFSLRLAIFSSFCVYFLNEAFVRVWVGEEQFGGVYLTLVFVLLSLQDTFIRGVSAVIIASGKIKVWSLVSILEGVFNIVFSLIMVKKYGLLGVALATILSKFLTTTWYTPYAICKNLNLNIMWFIRNCLIKVMYMSIPTLLSMFFVYRQTINSSDWVQLFSVGITGFIVNIIIFERKIIFNYIVRILEETSAKNKY